MSELAWLALYSGLILLFSLSGGCLPFLGRVTHFWLQIYLSVAAGIMLGAAFFHVMPDAFKLCGEASFGWWLALAVVGLYCIERFIAPHSHELNGHHHEHGPDGHHHHDPLPTQKPDEPGGHEHGHEHGHHTGVGEPRAAAPAIAGWMAVLGLTIHTFMNGFGLAGEVQVDTKMHGPWAFPGWAIFLAIVLHKPADALAISMVLSRKGVSRRLLTLVQFGFALMVPVGAAAFSLTRDLMDRLQLQQDVQLHLRNQLTGAALAFSAGTFLFIALSDLLPEVQFHKHDRVPLFASLVLSVAFMGGIGVLEDWGKAEQEAPKQEKVDGEGQPLQAPEGGPSRHDHRR